MNTLKIVFLMTFLTVLLVAVGQATFGSRGAVMALVIAVVLNFFTYFFSDRMVLATTGARLVSEEEAPELYAVVRSLATRANVTMPRVAIIPEEAPNAFATGRDPQHAVVAATEGILKILDRDELEAVLAHELGHVTGRDILLGAIAATLAGALTHLAQMAMWTGGGRRDDREGGGGGLVGILAIVLDAKPQAVSFEAANPRHAHEWTVWRDAALPDDKVLIPGVLDSSTNFVEHPELVAERILRFAGIVGRERTLAGSDCGFGTFAGYGKVDADVAFKKLRSLVEGAALASSRLWK